ncbi:MAG TPA: hypothetical protein VK961_02280 [Chthoniobacter sp.]|nr:hypothetical protein [Chthoniobacter sp.]
MTESDEEELHRLAAMLEAIDGTLALDSPLREALKKAGFALIVGFTHGLRPEIEQYFDRVGKLLTDAERAHLRGLGIDSDEA